MIIVSGILRSVLRMASFALSAITLIAAFGGYVDPEIWYFPSLLALVYPYLVLLTLIVALLWLINKHWITAAICAGSLLLGSSSLFDNFPFGRSEEAMNNEKTFSVMSFNLMHAQDVRQSDDQQRTLKYILNSDVDIICAQELFGINDENINQPSRSLLDSVKHTYPYIVNDQNSDQTIFSKYPAVLDEVDARENTWPKRFSRYTVLIEGKRVSIINVHLASYHLNNSERKVVTQITGARSAKKSVSEFKGSILSKMRQSYRDRAQDAEAVREQIDKTTGPLIICGDFNDVPASWAYRVIRGEDIEDAYTETGIGMMVTYNLHAFYFHLDQILYRPDGIKAISSEKGDIDASDHYPVIAQFKLQQ